MPIPNRNSQLAGILILFLTIIAPATTAQDGPRSESDIEERDGHGTTALMRAARASDANSTRQLLENGADPRGVDINGRTAAHYLADSSSHPEEYLRVFDLLVARGIDLAIEDEDGETALDIACETGKAKLVAAMVGLEKRQRPPDESQEAYHTQALLRLLRSHIESDEKRALKGAIEAMFDAGAQASYEDEKGQTLIHVSLKNYAIHGEILKVLLDRGVPGDSPDEEGRTPLMMVHETECAWVLVVAGADINARDDRGFTPLHHACEVSYTDLAAHCINWGADIRAESYEERQTPLFVAIEHTNSLAIQQLLIFGADPNIYFSRGKNALLKYLEGWEGDNEIRRAVSRMLLKRGIQSDKEDEQGNSAISVVLREPRDDGELLAILKAYAREESYAAIEKKWKKEIASAKSVECSVKVVDSAWPMLTALSYTGLGIYTREVRFRDAPDENWFSTTNSTLGLAGLCGVGIGGIAVALVIASNPDASGWQAFGRGITASIFGIGGFIVGSVIGVGLSCIPSVRERITTDAGFYYAVPCLVDAICLSYVIGVWRRK